MKTKIDTKQKLAVAKTVTQFLLSALLTLATSSQLHELIHVQAAPSQAAPSTSSITGHAPRFVHQPANVLVQAGQPHTIECPVEAEPEPEISWFRDGHLLASRPPHLEQTGNELMFIAISESDSGDYYCRASNALGSITSDRFKVTIQTSFHDAQMSFEPRLASVQPDRLVAFTCSLNSGANTDAANVDYPEATQAASSTSSQHQVFFARNNQRLPVRWVESSLNLSGENLNQIRSLGERYLARSLPNNQYQLLIVGTQTQLDDNSTYTCLYKEHDGGQQQQLAHESNSVQLRVITNLAPSTHINYNGLLQQDNASDYSKQNSNIKLDVDLGSPIQNLANLEGPAQIPNPNIYYKPGNNTQNSTSHLLDNNDETITPNINNNTLTFSLFSKTNLSYLYEFIKPILLLCAIFIVITNVALWFMWMRPEPRRRAQYKKHAHHQHHHYSAGSGSSGASSMLGSSFECDPVLKSLMGRTLSGCSSSGNNQLLTSAGGLRNSSSSLVNNASKKYRSYRDHMRCKVAAVGQGDQLLNNGAPGPFMSNNTATDLVDSLLQYQANPLDPHGLQTMGSQSGNLPNLYNQSLAAREQERNLLQQAAHMRSLNNIYNQNQTSTNNGQQAFAPRDFLQRITGLKSGNQTNNNQHQQRTLMPGSQLNLHTPFNQQNNHHESHQLWTTANYNNKPVFRPNQLSGDGQQTLVNCQLSSTTSNESPTHSPNSQCSSGISAGKTSLNNKQASNNRGQHLSSSSNHYSVIDTQINDDVDQEACYEELVDHQQQAADDHLQVSNIHNQQQQHQQTTSRNSSTRTTCTFVSGGLTFESLGDQAASNSKRNHGKLQQQHSDQLSPYAVSSIVCVGLPGDATAANNNNKQPPPPMTSEAIRALNEQFNIDQLMRMEEDRGTGKDKL